MTAIKSRIVPTITSEAAIACIGMYCMAVVMGYGRFLFTATLPDIMVQLSLSTTIAGWLASVNYIGYFIGALIAMFVPQRSTWQTMTLWAIISVVTTMLLVIPDMSLALWYLIRLVAGIASGVAMILSSSFVIQNLSPQRRSVLSAIHYSGIGVGISASAIVTWGLLALGYHFDVIWLVAGCTSLPLIWLLYAIKPKQINRVSQQSHSKQRISVHQSYLRFKRSLYEAISGHHKPLALLFVSYVLAGFGYISSATFLPVMAAQRLTTQRYAGLTIWLVVGIFAMLSNPLWGALAKRIGETKTLMGLTLLQASGMCLPILFDGAFGLYANAAILGLTFVGMVSMTLTLFKNINPSYSNLLIALATLAYALGQFLGPLVTVSLAGPQGNFNAGLLVSAIGLMIGLILIGLFRRQSTTLA